MAYFQDDGTVAAKAITIASQQAGKRYIWGAAGPDTFDCSGLVHFAYATAGLPGAGRPTGHLWTTGSIRMMGDTVPYGQEQPGDLVMTSIGHVGIAIGNNQMWNAPTTGIPVRIDKYDKAFSIRRIATPSNGIHSGSAQQADFWQDSGIAEIAHWFGQFFTWVGDSHNWFRMMEILGGSALIYISVKGAL